MAGFSTESRLNAQEFSQALNAILPQDIRAVETRQVEASFQARHQAELKRYCYHLWADLKPPLFFRRYLWGVGRSLDRAGLEAGLKILRGRHDFAAFKAAGSQVKGTVRTLHRAELEVRGRLYTFIFEADGFLRHMVRALVGTLVQLEDPEEMTEILASQNRARAGRTAPAQGLFLAWVRYPGQGRPAAAPGPFDLLE
ncbi:MAG: tRNA pseudouridine(38-40) synthase TruA [Deltaproteobacteria bacterium]|nr:tRNA pseudouridine(38-40) synthase TruA [Deltaproteobacteria bacterium]